MLLRQRIENQMGLPDAYDAHPYLEANNQYGKIVVIL